MNSKIGLILTLQFRVVGIPSRFANVRCPAFTKVLPWWRECPFKNEKDTKLQGVKLLLNQLELLGLQCKSVNRFFFMKLLWMIKINLLHCYINQHLPLIWFKREYFFRKFKCTRRSVPQSHTNLNQVSISALSFGAKNSVITHLEYFCHDNNTSSHRQTENYKNFDTILKVKAHSPLSSRIWDRDLMIAQNFKWPIFVNRKTRMSNCKAHRLN